MKNNRCIYCNGSVPHGTAGDHVIPAALGEFRNATNFKNICPRCNSKIAQCEEQLLRSGPEWLFRQIVVPQTRRSRGRPRVSKRGASGAPPPKILMHLPDHKEHVDLDVSDDGNLVIKPKDQMLVYSDDGRSYSLPLNKDMSPQSLRLLVKKLASEKKVKKIDKIIASFNEMDEDAYCKLFLQAWPEARYEHKPCIVDGSKKIDVQIKFEVTGLYFRAIAKIAFHYYLTQSQRSRGDEDHFREIRDFIMHGGLNERQKFFIDREIFVLPHMASRIGPYRWSHLLAAAEYDDGTVFAMVWLFYGPKFGGLRYSLRLGKIPSPILLPWSKWAHSYEYSEEGRYNGEVQPIGIYSFEHRNGLLY